MRCNCTEVVDNRAQAEVLKGRLVEKGCISDSLQDIIEQFGTIDRSTLLEGGSRKQETGTPLVPFITTLSTQHYQIKNIIRKHWHLLGNVRVIKTILPTNPEVIFRGVPSLRDKVASNVVDPPTKKCAFFQKLTGYHQCWKCQVCSINKNRNRRTDVFISTSPSMEHRIEPFITSSTTGIVYLLQFPCGLQYVGRTKRRYVLVNILPTSKMVLDIIQFPKIMPYIIIEIRPILFL